MTRTTHGADYLVLSSDKVKNWHKNSILIQADDYTSAEILADQLLNKGAAIVFIYRWASDAEGYINVPFRR